MALRSRLLRWAVIEAIQRACADSAAGAVKAGIIARPGKEARTIAKVAAARRVRADKRIRAGQQPSARDRSPSG